MTPVRITATCVAIAMLASAPMFAQGKSGSAPGKQSTGSNGGGKSNGGGASSTAGSGSSNRSSHGANQKPMVMPPRGNAGDNSSAHATTASSGASGGRNSKTSSTTASATTISSAPNPISTKISKNPKLLARLEGMLPAGMTIEEASAGFRNQGQFIAALEVSKNRNISFVDLQEAMTEDGLSLGQAAKQLAAQPSTSGGTTSATGTSPKTKSKSSKS